MKTTLLVLADLLRADLAEFSLAVQNDDLDAAAEKLDDFRARLDAAVEELRG